MTFLAKMKQSFGSFFFVFRRKLERTEKSPLAEPERIGQLHRCRSGDCVARNDLFLGARYRNFTARRSRHLTGAKGGFSYGKKMVRRSHVLRL